MRTEYGTIKNGVATTSIFLAHQNTAEGKPLEVCHYIFVAAHFAAKPLQSKELVVTKKSVSFVFELDDVNNFSKWGDLLLLKDTKGNLISKKTSQDIIHKSNKSAIEFTGLEADIYFDLEIQNSKGVLVESIFKKKDYRDLKIMCGKNK